jgi:hypothetical protein
MPRKKRAGSSRFSVVIGFDAPIALAASNSGGLSFMMALDAAPYRPSWQDRAGLVASDVDAEPAQAHAC